MPHKALLSGLKETGAGLKKVGRKALREPADKLQDVFEGEVLRRIGIAPIGTFEKKGGLKPLPAPQFKLTSSTRRRPPATQGFQTPHLQELHRQGSEAQSKRAREQMRRLGRRLKTKGVDF
jgi:hypothetical protein